ncbi:BspA family leucine-rich repeat surface protein [Pediococcus claussenii]|uniref:KxYKxGKxW signal peptide domain protein n=1 Tax=Pediococcus claussenii (strain ATCC BAA-344 / DSM 14800 / JCM 18046 / KCTC 3811 / LMG 21948 / P06) TaxID=701521 RepID=G8PCD5_PEDCP|nr:BspA family leucine-rich repeat surface protein [Pediococcus claussenii]AEV94920.1 kxYKxGKxW signal peptide domain protein [Pediococcus claussenii ATCC BAA-344]ANZ70116.1 hypothetical protein AYR57_07190 [Pediococcus claussenii]ANZ71931.1 hypothetical protein AYR58_07190 [Pediococcus claussenii]KRN18830.1 hypothetical protein IV79_GL000328 [Pediococcus claussenii]
MDTKKHYKLYKAGKQWLIAAITTIGIFGAMGVASAHADTVTNQTDTTTQTTPSSNSVASSSATSSFQSQSSSETSTSGTATNSQNSKATSLSSFETATNSSAASSSPAVQNSAASSSTTTSSMTTTKAVSSSNTADSSTSSQAGTVSSTASNTAVPASSSSTNSIVKSGVFGTSAWDIDSQGDLNIHAGVLGSSTDAGKWNGITSNNINTINIDQGVVANADSSYLFSDDNAAGVNSSLTKFNGLENLDTSNVSDMSYMFSGLNSITELDLTKFNTSKVTNMRYMFAGALTQTGFVGNSQIKNINVSSFDTSKVTTMEGMFAELASLQSLNLSNFNTKNVTNMLGMFSFDVELKTLNVTNFDTSHVTTTQGMFWGTSALETIDVANWDVSNVTDMSFMFATNSNLKTLDVSNWNVSSLTNAMMLFAGSPKLSNIDITKWVAPHLKDITGMFGWSGVTSLDLSNFDMPTVIKNGGPSDLALVFYGYLDGLKAVTLGSKSIINLNESEFGVNPSYGQVVLDFNGNPTNYAYGADGKVGYQAVGTGTIDNPNGPVYTWQEMNALYQNGGPVETYVLAEHAIQPTTVNEIFTADDGSISSGSHLVLDNNTVLNGNSQQQIISNSNNNFQFQMPPLSLNNGEYVLDTDLSHSKITVLDSLTGNVSADMNFEQFASYPNVQGSDANSLLSSILSELSKGIQTSNQSSSTINVTYNYIHQVAAPITVNYVDDQGKVLATDTATYPNGQFINESYTTTQKSIDGYTFKQLSSDSLTASGVLNSTGGTVTYVYTQDVSQPITLNVIDTDTGQILNSTDFSGDLNDSLTIQDSDYIPAQYHLATGDELNGQAQLQDSSYTWTTAPQTLNIYVSGDKSTVTQTRNVTRTIKFITPDNETSFGDITETVQLSRDVTTDLATGAVVKTTDWAAAGSDAWRGITIPTIDGYHTSITVLPAQTVTGTTANSIIQIKYIAN